MFRRFGRQVYFDKHRIESTVVVSVNNYVQFKQPFGNHLAVLRLTPSVVKEYKNLTFEFKNLLVEVRFKVPDVFFIFVRLLHTIKLRLMAVIPLNATNSILTSLIPKMRLNLVFAPYLFCELVRCIGSGFWCYFTAWVG